MRDSARYAMDEEAGFQAHLQREPCAVVLFRGRQCPYSAALERGFQELAAGDEAFSYVVRECHAGDKGEPNHKYGVRTTPTVVLFEHGRESKRIEARPLVGLPKHRVQAWLDEMESAC